VLKKYYYLLVSFIFFTCTKSKDEIGLNYLEFTSYSIDGISKFTAKGVSPNPVIRISFSQPVDRNTFSAITVLGNQSSAVSVNANLINKDSTIEISFKSPLSPLNKYTLSIAQDLKSQTGNKLFSEISTNFTTAIDTSDKFPRIADDVLLTKIQEQTFKYFWDFGHPVSGMARERNSSGDLVTTGGTGFGIMSILVGIERKFITREQGLQRIKTIAEFLDTKAVKYHGAFAHWLNGITGTTIPFSSKDDGGDLVETSFLIAGLLCASEFFDRNESTELKLRETIKKLWENVEWNWYTKSGSNVLYWHWSPKYNWEMNHQIKGWNEALITYVLAASSPTYPINKSVYDVGWASNGNLKNGKSFYGINLPLGPDLGGPLFFEHYSFLGINPSKLKDKYTDYQTQAVNHSKINFEYCKANPQSFYGYSRECWGLTASDTKGGYSAHSPTNDKGVISPTAALSSMPFTPEESMYAIRYFYYKLGDKLFKEYGFIDAFSLHEPWFADSFLAIDQGPAIIMIENHRSGLIWNYTMKNKDIKNGLSKLGFEF